MLLSLPHSGFNASSLQGQLLWAENAAVLSFALQQWQAGLDSAQLQEAVTEKVVQEVSSGCRGGEVGLHWEAAVLGNCNRGCTNAACCCSCHRLLSKGCCRVEHANTCHKHVSMPMSPQTKAEWAGILMGLSDSQRRAFLSLAIATEGLDLVQMPQHLSGLRKMLEPLTKPVYPGASRRIFQAAFHCGALQVRSVSRECRDGPSAQANVCRI